MLPEINKIKGIHPSYIIKRELKSKGLKSSELAANISEHKQTISAILNRRRKITPSLSIKLSEIFNVDEDYFMILQVSYDIRTLVNSKTEKIKPNLNKFREILFWDTDINKIDWTKQKRAVIKRILERGNHQEIEEIISFYGKSNISSEIKNINTSILPTFNENISYHNL